MNHYCLRCSRELTNCMCLPEGKTCDDCVHFERCSFLGATSKGQTECDWFPIRFKCVS